MRNARIFALLAGATVAWAALSGTATARPITASAGHGAVSAPRSSAATLPAEPATITVAAVGDLLFDSAPKRLIWAKGPKAPFSTTREYLHTADFTVGNLECPLSKRGRAVAGKTFTFQGDPRATQGLTWAGFDVVGMGNNHARDYGATALSDTFKYLDAAQIAHAGAGKNRTAAWKPAIVTRGGARIAYLSFSQIGPSNFAATSSRSGTAYTMSRSAVDAAIRKAHKQADYVIVSFHWGVERDYTPTARQVADGRSAIRAGADLVLSHHPHVIQGVEFYRKGLIAYSLGNFVFSPGSDAGRDSMILRLTLGPHGVRSVTARPVRITSGRPNPSKGAEARRILGIIKRTSAGRGTHVHLSATTARLSKD
jgi:poly-gamma-glutamate synthesis protein (capsule biosynthesis protein)